MDESFLQIDRNRLDRECSHQPELYFTHAKELADAMLRLDQVKSELDIVRAELTLDISERPDRYGISKTTVSMIEVAMLKHEKYKKALSKVHTVRHEVEVHSATVKALEHRKRALENLVTLTNMNYFSEPRHSKEDKDALDRDAKRRVRTLGRRREAEVDDE